MRYVHYIDSVIRYLFTNAPSSVTSAALRNCNSAFPSKGEHKRPIWPIRGGAISRNWGHCMAERSDARDDQGVRPCFLRQIDYVFATVRRAERLPRLQVDLFSDEARSAVAHEHQDPARMHARRACASNCGYRPCRQRSIASSSRWTARAFGICGVQPKLRRIRETWSL